MSQWGRELTSRKEKPIRKTIAPSLCRADRVRSLEVEGAFGVEELEVAEDVGFDFGWLGFGVQRLEFGDDLLDRVLAVAALDNFQARAVESERTFGHEQDALLIVFAEANARSEARFGVGTWSH
jgi:hypothetical protein